MRRLVSMLLATAVVASCGGGFESYPVPAFEAPWLDAAGSFNVDGHMAEDGRPLLINLWASWCGPCREEMPALDQAAVANPEVAFVGIAVLDREEQARQFLAEVAIGFPTALDRNGEVAEALGVIGLPVTLIVVDGEVVDEYRGPLDLKGDRRPTALAVLPDGPSAPVGDQHRLRRPVDPGNNHPIHRIEDQYLRAVRRNPVPFDDIVARPVQVDNRHPIDDELCVSGVEIVEERRRELVVKASVFAQRYRCPINGQDAPPTEREVLAASIPGQLIGLKKHAICIEADHRHPHITMGFSCFLSGAQVDNVNALLGQPRFIHVGDQAFIATGGIQIGNAGQGSIPHSKHCEE